MIGKLDSLQSATSKGDLKASKRSFVELVDAVQVRGNCRGEGGVYMCSEWVAGVQFPKGSSGLLGPCDHGSQLRAPDQLLYTVYLLIAIMFLPYLAELGLLVLPGC
jgi:hypothetical protein